MNNLTRFKIVKPANEVFEAFVDPSKIKNFWFSSSSERWEQGKKITLEYDLYNAVVEIKVVEIKGNEKIVFSWGTSEEEHVVTITLNEIENSITIIEVNEEGFNENDDELIHKMLDNKEGWVFVLTCLKGYLESDIKTLREGLVKG
ncbi:SRPBCC domain-containing protein [Bacillus sp. RG28]|uniref:SRPBCC domain-containing protein n=1 Tax=Gottfriedia endophytica TaxID=2820819 RepID=A0A940NM44_9BACI|nr:SRPBCC domain-containing protein [Gottfriedia endophytica]MBP0726792.1 SRPBCC domain-containing protein [Gottfriedia endophytica]